MAQHDVNIANQRFPSFRTDLNNALLALMTSSSGPNAPNDTFGGMLFYSTATGRLYIRNSGNTAWIQLFEFNSGVATFSGEIAAPNGSAAAPAIRPAANPNCGLFWYDGGTAGIAVGGEWKLAVGAASVASAVEHRAPAFLAGNRFQAPANDNAGAPGFCWADNTNRGMFETTNGVGISVGGTRILADADNVRMYRPLLVEDGTDNAPGIAFASHSADGIFKRDNSILVAIDGDYTLEVQNDGISLAPGCVYRGDGSGLTELPTGVVLDTIANAALGARGTYATLARLTGDTITAGTTYSGPSLAYASIDDSGNIRTGGSPSGSWQAQCASGGGGSKPCGVFKRV